MEKHGIKETLEVLELAGSVIRLGRGLMDGFGLGDVGLVKNVVEDISPAIDDIELVWKNELKDLDEAEVNQIKEKVMEIAGGLIVVDEDWFEVGSKIVMSIITIVRLIKIK